MAVIRFEPIWISVLNQRQRGVADYELIRTEDPIEIASFGYDDGIQRTNALGFDMQEILKVIERSQMQTEANLRINIIQPARNFIFSLHQDKEQVEEPPTRYRTTQVSLAPEEVGEYLVYLDRLFIGSGVGGSTLAEAIQLGWDGGLYIYKSGLGSEPGVGLAENLSIQIEGEWANQTPSVNGPIGGASQNVAEPVTFDWTHNGTLDQEGFELRYRARGGGDWTVVEEETSSQSYTLPPGELTLAEYEWQVRTISEHGFESLWSSLSVFTVAELPPTPVIIRPADGEEIGISDLHVEWEAEEQYMYHLELLDESGNVIDSMQSPTTSRRDFVFEDLLENNSNYTLRLRINAVFNGLYSAWSEVDFSVSYTTPADPEIVFIKDEKAGSITLYIDNPTPDGTEPITTHQHLFRRRKGESEWIKLADSLEVDAHFVDYTPASNTDYEYRLRLFGDNETSAFSSIFTTSISIGKATILSIANEPAELIRLEIVRSRSTGKNYNSTTRNFAGRRLPVTEFGEALESSLDMECLVKPDEFNLLNNLIDRNETLLYRDSRGRKKYVTISNISVTDEYKKFLSVELPLTEVDYNEAIE